MRILIIQEAGRHKENQIFREALSLQRAFNKLNTDAVVWGLNYPNFKNVPNFQQYDIIINLENYDETNWIPDLSLYSKPYKILWSIDAHVKGINAYLNEFVRGNYNLILQATKDYVNSNSIWFPNCYDDELITPGIFNDKIYYVGFCGSLLNRKQILDKLTQDFQLKQDIFKIGFDMIKKVQSYWIHFNINIANDINYRSFETLGCGATLLTNANYQYEELGFVHEHNYLKYQSLQELYDTLKFYQDKTNKLIDIAKNGIQLAKRHTYYQRAKYLLQFLQNKI